MGNYRIYCISIFTMPTKIQPIETLKNSQKRLGQYFSHLDQLGQHRIYYVKKRHCGSSRGGKMYGLFTKCEVKMAGYWPSPFLRVYGPRLRLGP